MSLERVNPAVLTPVFLERTPALPIAAFRETNCETLRFRRETRKREEVVSERGLTGGRVVSELAVARPPVLMGGAR